MSSVIHMQLNEQNIFLLLEKKLALSKEHVMMSYIKVRLSFSDICMFYKILKCVPILCH